MYPPCFYHSSTEEGAALMVLYLVLYFTVHIHVYTCMFWGLALIVREVSFMRRPYLIATELDIHVHVYVYANSGDRYIIIWLCN